MTSAALDRLLARPRRTTSVTVPYDPTAADAARQARSIHLAVAGTDDGPAARETAARLEAELVTVTFHLADIGGDAVEALLAKHPASKAQKAAAHRAGTRRPEVNHDTYAPALLAACCTGIVFSDGDTLDAITAAQAAEILTVLSVEDRTRLHGECLRLASEATVIEPGG